MGWRPTVAQTFSYFSASSTADAEVSNCVPTTFIPTSASAARRITASRSSAYATKFVCVCASKYFNCISIFTREKGCWFFICKNGLFDDAVRFGHEGFQHTDNFVQFRRKLFDKCLSFFWFRLYEFEWLSVIYLLVQRLYLVPHIIKRHIVLVCIECIGVFFWKPLWFGARDGLSKIGFSECHDAGRYVAKTICKVRVVPFIELFPRHVRIFERMYVAEKQAPCRIGAIAVDEFVGADDIAERFAHLLSAGIDESVVDDTVGVLDAARHKHCLPHNRLKAHLILAGKL